MPLPASLKGRLELRVVDAPPVAQPVERLKLEFADASGEFVKRISTRGPNQTGVWKWLGKTRRSEWQES